MRFAGYGGVKERKSPLKDFDLLSVVVQNLTLIVRMWDTHRSLKFNFFNCVTEPSVYRMYWIRMRLLLYILFVFASQSCFAQGFWYTTRDFPGGVKTTFAGLEDSVLIVGTPNGIWRSDNEGYSWTKKLSSSYVFSLHASSTGTIVAGGKGKLFFSYNKGISWDSVSVPTSFPIIKIVENKDHEYFLIASGFTNEEGFVGDGVFYNNGDLKTWVQRNTGLPTTLRSAEHLAVDKNGRIYLTLPDENTTGLGGLYFSNDDGLTWQQSPLVVNNLGTIKVLNSFSISITPQDSVLVSVSGTAVNISTRLNVIKHINDVSKNTPWRPWSIRKLGNWWEDLNLNTIHFTKNGDWYSSVTNSISTGGSFYSTDKGMNWIKRTQGMGISRTDRYESNLHYESSTGKLFMVQFLDERVYYTNQSLLNPVALSGTLKDDQGKPLAGVTIQARNMLVGSNAQGDYSVIVPGGWSGKVTPSLGNYVFDPEFASITNAQGSIQKINFVGTYIGSYFISGRVTDVSGQPIAQISLAGFPAVVTTNEFGYYVAEVPARWSGTITPTLNGYEFNPESIIFPEVQANQIEQNFILRKIGMVYITGQLKDAKGDPFTNATLTGFPETTHLNATGNFYGEVPTGWSGTVIPVAEGYTFTPDKIQVANLQSDLLNQVFTAFSEQVVTTYLVSGIIKNQSGSPLNNILITGLPTEIKTSVDGSYQVELPKGWSGVITPVSEKYVFNPVSIPINNLTTTLSNQNFVASIITAVDDIEIRSFSVYPNPSYDRRIIIQSNYNGFLTIMNSMGQLVWSGLSFDLPDSSFLLPDSGIFMVTITNQHKTRSLKVIAQ